MSSAEPDDVFAAGGRGNGLGEEGYLACWVEEVWRFSAGWRIAVGSPCEWLLDAVTFVMGVAASLERSQVDCSTVVPGVLYREMLSFPSTSNFPPVGRLKGVSVDGHEFLRLKSKPLLTSSSSPAAWEARGKEME